jgi:hypothetical protein
MERHLRARLPERPGPRFSIRNLMLGCGLSGWKAWRAVFCDDARQVLAGSNSNVKLHVSGLPE